MGLAGATYGAGLGAALGTIVPGVGNVIGSALGGIVGMFSGAPEDKSATGYNSYIQSSNRAGVSFPSKEWILMQGAAAGWSADKLNAIRSTYDQNTGTASQGDWRIAVSNLSPVVLSWYKGAGEHFDAATNAAFQATSNVPPTTASTQARAAAAAFGDQPAQTNKSIPWWGWALMLLVPFGLLGFLIFKRK